MALLEENPKREEPYDVNDVDTPKNPTMLKQIRADNSGPVPQTSYGRASTQ